MVSSFHHSTFFQSSVYLENTSEAWDIPWYTTRKRCITIIYFFHLQVKSSYDSGDCGNARRYPNTAKWLNVAAIICGVVVIVFIIIWFTVPSGGLRCGVSELQHLVYPAYNMFHITTVEPGYERPLKSL